MKRRQHDSSNITPMPLSNLTNPILPFPPNDGIPFACFSTKSKSPQALGPSGNDQSHPDSQASTKRSSLNSPISLDCTLINSPGIADDFFLQYLRSPPPDSGSLLQAIPSETAGKCNPHGLILSPKIIDAEARFPGIQGTGSPSDRLHKIRIHLQVTKSNRTQLHHLPRQGSFCVILHGNDKCRTCGARRRRRLRRGDYQSHRARSDEQNMAKLFFVYLEAG